MPDHPALSLPSRRLVYACVGANPGAHLRDVARRCSMPLGTTLYHLDALDAAGLVAPRRDGRYKRYFVAADVGRADKDLLSVLRHATPRRIVLALLASPSLTQRELCATLSISRSTLSFHAAHLVAGGVLGRDDARPEGRYRVSEPDAARAVLLRFRESLATPADAVLFDAVAAAAPSPAWRPLEGVA